jgi:hypothetical protein
MMRESCPIRIAIKTDAGTVMNLPPTLRAQLPEASKLKQVVAQVDVPDEK